MRCYCLRRFHVLDGFDVFLTFQEISGVDTIRIEWRSPRDIVVPGIKKALAALGQQGATIESPIREAIDLTARGRANLKSAEDKILYSAERGNLLAAIKLARRTYNFNLAEAKQFVEDLLE